LAYTGILCAERSEIWIFGNYKKEIPEVLGDQEILVFDFNP